MELMAAQFAREAARKAIEEETIVQVTEIATAIKKAAENGKYYIDWYQPIAYNVREYIIRMGYNIHDYTERNESYTTIDWKEKV